MGKFIDLTGQRFGRLVVVKRVENKGKSVAWECICDCGNKKIVTSIGLTRGHTKSCGCFGAENLDKIHKQHTTHNQSFSKLYRIWCVMKQRCNNPNAQHYSTYGGRGIKVCDEWQEFEPFRDWALANGYDENAERGQCTLDRIDANRNYCPENCRWVTRAQQTRNTRKNKIYKGKCLCEWYRISKMPYNQFYELVKKIGLESTVKTLELDKE